MNRRNFLRRSLALLGIAPVALIGSRADLHPGVLVSFPHPPMELDQEVMRKMLEEYSQGLQRYIALEGFSWKEIV
jgi:hypothetical protein